MPTAESGVSLVKKTIEPGVPVKDRPVAVTMGFWKISKIMSPVECLLQNLVSHS